MTPHFLSLNQDIVAGSYKDKWGLKYEFSGFKSISGFVVLYTNH